MPAAVARVRAGPCLARGRGAPSDAGQITLEVGGGTRPGRAIVYWTRSSILDPRGRRERPNCPFAGKTRRQGLGASGTTSPALIIRLANEGKRGFCGSRVAIPSSWGGRGGEEAFALGPERHFPSASLPGLTAGLGRPRRARTSRLTRDAGHQQGGPSPPLATGHAAGTEEDLDRAALAAHRPADRRLIWA